MTINTTDQQVFQALGTFIQLILPDLVVIQGQQNRTPMPKTDFCLMNNVGKRRLSMNHVSYTDTTDQQTLNADQSTEYTIQIDFYGAKAGENAQSIFTLINDGYGWDAFPDYVKPLTTGDPVQTPLITGEKQYLERWRVDVKMQYNPVVTAPIQFFDDVDIETINVSNNFQSE